jgi:hypothetical protein
MYIYNFKPAIVEFRKRALYCVEGKLPLDRGIIALLPETDKGKFRVYAMVL